MQISLPKTEITLFVQNNIENQEPVVTIDNHVLQYNKNPKVLGVHLDEKLNFKKHLEIISHKASRCLGVLREINGIAKLSSKKLIQLYIGLVRPVLEYGCLAWQTATSQDSQPLEYIQKKALAPGINLRCAFAPFAHKTTLGRRKNRRRRRFGASSFGAALWYFMSVPRFFGRPLYRSARLL